MMQSVVQLSLTDASFDTSTGLVSINFTDVCPKDHPDPAGWTPTKRFTVQVRPEFSLAEGPLNVVTPPEE
jgi:hypothetical protein